MTDSDDRKVPVNRRAYDLRETEFYMPAMWPMDLQNAIVDWLGAWRWRRQMRHLLQLEARGLARLGDARDAVSQGAAACGDGGVVAAGSSVGALAKDVEFRVADQRFCGGKGELGVAFAAHQRLMQRTHTGAAEHEQAAHHQHDHDDDQRDAALGLSKGVGFALHASAFLS